MADSAASITDHTFRVQSAGNLGALEITTFIALVIYGVSLSQGLSYYQRSAPDKLRLKLFVSLVLVLDTFHSFTAAHTIYFTTVTRWNRAEANSVPLSATVMNESIITFLIQCFFVHRIYRLSTNAPLALVCLVPTGLRLSCALALSVAALRDVFHTPNGVFVHSVAWVISAGLALGAAADLLIAGCMLWYLRQMFSGYNLRSTTETLNRLVRGSLQTGLLTSMTSVTVIITFQAMSNMVWFGLYVVLAKLYALSLLVSLNTRRHGKAFEESMEDGFGGVTHSLQFNTAEQRSVFSDVSMARPVPDIGNHGV